LHVTFFEYSSRVIDIHIVIEAAVTPRDERPRGGTVNPRCKAVIKIAVGIGAAMALYLTCDGVQASFRKEKELAGKSDRSFRL